MPRLTSLFADWADLNAADEPASGEALADALLHACEGLTDEVLRALPGTPDDAQVNALHALAASGLDEWYPGAG